MKLGKLSGPILSACSILVVLAASGAPEPAFAGNARGKLYSTAAVNRFCKEAQLIIANTTLAANNVVWDELGTSVPPPATGFIGSDATPYDGATDLPLSTTQYVGYGTDSSGKDCP